MCVCVSRIHLARCARESAREVLAECSTDDTDGLHYSLGLFPAFCVWLLCLRDAHFEMRSCLTSSNRSLPAEMKSVFGETPKPDNPPPSPPCLKYTFWAVYWPRKYRMLPFELMIEMRRIWFENKSNLTCQRISILVPWKKNERSLYCSISSLAWDALCCVPVFHF